MKKDSKIYLVLFTIIILVIVSIYLFKGTPSISEEETAKCIGQNSELYVQLGCSHCKTQEELFGENYQYLNVIDCTVDKEKCIEADIRGTPTWIINEQKITGVQTIEQLKEFTNCK